MRELQWNLVTREEMFQEYMSLWHEYQDVYKERNKYRSQALMRANKIEELLSDDK